MGTPEFAVSNIKILKDAGYNIVGVVTQPDKPKGRGYKMCPPPVKEYALKEGIQVYQPNTLKDEEIIKILEELNPELIVVAAYGKILPKNVLDYPKYGCINVHASLLPKYRGSSPIHRAIINGDKITGITIMYMDEGMDTGDIILQKEMPINDSDTAGQLHDKLALMGAETLLSAVKLIEKEIVIRCPQNNQKATYAPMLTKNEAQVDWNKPANEIKNFIRGLNPWPVAYTYYLDKKVRLWSSEIAGSCNEGIPGTIIEYIPNKGLLVKAGKDTSIFITEIQFEGGKKMTVDEYLRGHDISSGVILGSL